MIIMINRATFLNINITVFFITITSALSIFQTTLLNCVPYTLTCQRTLCAYLLTGQLVLRAYVLTCQHASGALVLMCLTCSQSNVPFVPTCSRAVTSNNKNKFSMTCFTYIFGTFLLSFSGELKLYMKSARQAGMSLEIFILRIQ